MGVVESQLERRTHVATIQLVLGQIRISRSLSKVVHIAHYPCRVAGEDASQLHQHQGYPHIIEPGRCEHSSSAHADPEDSAEDVAVVVDEEYQRGIDVLQHEQPEEDRWSLPIFRVVLLEIGGC